MLDIFNRMLADPEKMAKIKGCPFREAAFFALYNYVRKGGALIDLPWFAASKSARDSREKAALKKAA